MSKNELLWGAAEKAKEKYKNESWFDSYGISALYNEEGVKITEDMPTIYTNQKVDIDNTIDGYKIRFLWIEINK